MRKENRMANNRIYLKCKCCGKTLFLGKRLGGGYYISDYACYNGVPLEDRLNRFYDEHAFCPGTHFKGLDCFEIEYEMEPTMTNINDKPIYDYGLPWLVIAHLSDDHEFVSARFLTQAAAEAYVEDCRNVGVRFYRLAHEAEVELTKS